mgnify:CR=1
MTYRELIEKLQALSPEQLDSQVKLMDEKGTYNLESVWALSEDYVNPSDEFLEPISVYENDDSLDLEEYDLTVAYTKGTVFLTIQ